MGLPTSAYYCASKFALEGFTESLSMELDPTWNIKVSRMRAFAESKNDVNRAKPSR
ncbi:hypothetical protein CPC08DRAFT_770358 [Agrocybe pediades]|nr:hypothetical protein CPC08DRAFT_770358 [Agrocybe pediades]